MKRPAPAHPAPVAMAIALAAAFAVFWVKIGLPALDVTRADWFLLKSGDVPAEYFSWAFFRNTPWSFPLGRISGYGYPFETSVVLTGAIAWLAIPLKVLSPLLPATFQYFGWWYLSCYLLQAWFAVKLLGIYPWTQKTAHGLAAVLFVLSPALLDRTGHVNLCCHWMLLASLWLYLAPPEAVSARKKIVFSLALVLVSGLTHPYLVLMTLPLALATFLRLWHIEKQISWQHFLLAAIGTPLTLVLMWYLCGAFMLSADNVATLGFGKFSANLNTLYNPLDKAAILQAFATYCPEQYEGFAYLGAGMLLLAVVAITVRLQGGRLQWKPYWPLLLTTFLLTVFALSDTVTFHQYRVLLYTYWGYFRTFADTFRASGRFIWLLHYLVLLAAVVYGLRLLPAGRGVTSMLGAVLLVQLLDLQPLLKREFEHSTPYRNAAAMAPWDSIAAHTGRLVVYPPFLVHNATFFDYQQFALIAARHRIAVTTAYLARNDDRLKKQYTNHLDSLFAAGMPGDEAGSVFITPRHFGYKFEPMVRNGNARAYAIDSFVVAVPTSLEKLHACLRTFPERCKPVGLRGENLADYLERHRDMTILLAVRDEATFKLCEAAKNYLESTGAAIRQLGFRGAYAAVIHHNKTIAEKVDNDHPVELRFKAGVPVNGWSPATDVFLRSVGGHMGSTEAVIRIGSNTHGNNERGFNIVVLDNQGAVVEATYFDTFTDCYHTVSY